MTSLHPTATDPSRPCPPVDGAGAPPPPAARCSITTAADPGPADAEPSGLARHDSVPQPRGPRDAAVRDAAVRDAAVREVAVRDAGPRAVELPDVAPQEGRARDVQALAAAPAPSGQSAPTPGPVPAPVALPRPVRERPHGLGPLRPSPSRRLRRMHPQSAPTGQEAAARETAATDPAGTAPRADLRTGPGAAHEGAPTHGATNLQPAPAADAVAAWVPPGAGWAGAGAGWAAGGVVEAGAGPGAGLGRAEPPLGILISSGPGQPEAAGRPEERAPVRVAAHTVRVGRGTSLVVLPSWRPAIAVSVPTEQLLSATGLTVERLGTARLTVLMNPGALHDRELDLHGWESTPSGRGRRGGRP
ncbi:hypothetical protein [Streptomyces rubellomurinus]|uniref:Uncharacterized protein n=1 Tax=Streptomyces rubellomurinus (strain ATCC 31215) TaxID=359131 RepID=A0A0F2T6L3_STRR3|nr:hypothetical protein [Streptomyces rubellomurinus]KJS58041.1 hypothetical protein VM95_35840 [Streptomyces rubellomurinus]